MSSARRLICAALHGQAVGLGIITVAGLPGQAEINAEIHLLPRPARTRERVTEVCTMIRQIVSDATGCSVAVRAWALDPQTYVSLK